MSDTYPNLDRANSNLSSPIDLTQDATLRGELDAQASAAVITGEAVIPLVAEQLNVGKRVVETGRVRLTKVTQQHTETVDLPLEQVHYQVERTPVNQVVPQQPEIRFEGDTIVYPVVEERLVVTTELVLLEEVRVTRTTSQTQGHATYTLKSEQLVEERLPANEEGATS